MDTNLEQVLSAGLDVAIAAFGVAFTYKGTTYYGVQADNDYTLELTAGGFRTDYQFSLHCRKADFSTLPEPGETLTRAGKLFRFVHVITSEGDPGVRYNCTCTDS